MNDKNSIILFIILKQSYQLSGEKMAEYAANAVQHILIKYFTLQVLSVKANSINIDNTNHITNTTKWLASNAKKQIISVDDAMWDKLKSDLNTDICCLKEHKTNDSDKNKRETTLVIWPKEYNVLPDYLKEMVKIC